MNKPTPGRGNMPMAHASPSPAADSSGDGPRRLRLMSYNIQTGIETRYFHHYLTGAWRHVLPSTSRQGNLDRIGQVITDFDIVGLQEIDAGSLRSGFVNQAAYLAQRGGFPYWHFQTNRRIGRLARHSNGLLSRLRPLEVRDHKLPGVIPGRGALVARFGGPGESLHVVLVHLALGPVARLRQLEYIARLVSRWRHVVLMGDMNCPSRSPEFEVLGRLTDLREPIHDLNTFPSWRPERNIDHILVSRSLRVTRAEVVDHPLSDHLPITMEVQLPDGLELVA